MKWLAKVESSDNQLAIYPNMLLVVAEEVGDVEEEVAYAIVD